MIISEKQLFKLIAISQLYLKLLGDICRDEKLLLTTSAQTNIDNITDLLDEILDQQSDELRVVE